MGETKIYAGQIVEADNGEAMDIIFLKDRDEPLASIVRDDLRQHGSNVSVSYFTSDQSRSKAELDEILILQGIGEADYGDHYSEFTGYLWTDEDLKVGGHDLLAELRSNVGRYLHMEITYYRAVEMSEFVLNGRRIHRATCRYNFAGTPWNIAGRRTAFRDLRVLAIVDNLIPCKTCKPLVEPIRISEADAAKLMGTSAPLVIRVPVEIEEKPPTPEGAPS